MLVRCVGERDERFVAAEGVADVLVGEEISVHGRAESRALALGAKDFLGKPFDAGEVGLGGAWSKVSSFESAPPRKNGSTRSVR